LLPLAEGKQVESIEYLPPEMVPETPLGKNSIVDVRCEETGGRKFIVEMQMEWFPDFKQRVLLNSAKAYVRQLPKGNDYQLLQPVYSLNLVNHTFEPDMDGYYHYYHLVHDLDSNKVLDGLHIVFVELPKFKAKNLTEKKMQILWLRFLTEIDRDGADDVSQDLLDNPQTGEALEIVKESGLNDVERAAYEGFWDRVSIETTKKAYEDRLVAERDAANAERDAAVEKLKQDKLQSARQMKGDGMAAETIAKYTGLTVDEIAAPKVSVDSAYKAAALASENAASEARSRDILSRYTKR
jgi:predicted transposase/invertase (TIGR01784 family)